MIDVDPTWTPGEEPLRRSQIFDELARFMPCRFSPAPLPISRDMVDELRRLGRVLLQFNKALNKLYHESVTGNAPPWIATYLDGGKPGEIVQLSREKAFRRALPSIIRPDILMHDGKLAICELDSVPGGFGLTARMAQCYRRHGHHVFGDISIEDGFVQAVPRRPLDNNHPLIIVVSDESQGYLDEMNWLAAELRDRGYPVHVANPRDLHYTDESVLTRTGTTVSADTVYRFMEMFDYQQISKWNLLMYLATAKRVHLSPPPKAFLEEKLWFALFHHPVCEPHWRRHLQVWEFDLLRELIPRTWIMDPAPVPPQATIPGLTVDGIPIQSWDRLHSLSQKQREMVIKPSGFSPEAWGSRGVVVGHDMSNADWSKAVNRSLGSFPSPTSILQTYIAPDQIVMAAFGASADFIEQVEGRARFTPYYFVIDGEAILSNILVTHCSKEKKKIHGMSDAIMTVCAI